MILIVMVGMPKMRDGWVGLWLIPFGLVSGAILALIWAGVKFGWENMRVGRAPVVWVGVCVLVVLWFILNGWGARQATGRVYPGVPINMIGLSLMPLPSFPALWGKGCGKGGRKKTKPKK